MKNSRKNSAELKFINAWSAPLLKTRILDLAAWAGEHVRLPGSARSERFDCNMTPWLREPLNKILDGKSRIITFIKPVQSGGSVLGEVAICYWLSNETGDIQFNWEDDEKARDRWDKREKRIIKACKTIQFPVERFQEQKCLLTFPRGNMTMQGVHTESNLDSDSIRFQVNEEVHNWQPGRLIKAYNRTTAYWNAIIVNISNASKKGDQLYQAWDEGTRQHWQVRCPGCGQYHQMRTRWDKEHPELGGLRYDADGCRREDGTYDYNRIEPTVRFQMPCGAEVRDTPQERRVLSLSGCYTEPTNTGAHESNRSYTLEAVAVDYIPWLKLIQEKHRALFARNNGDLEPWRRYVTERECGFYDPEMVPIAGRIILSDTVKDRAGMPNRKFRWAALDRQQGERAKGEFPHWWMVIRDFDVIGNSLLVFEGKLLTDQNVVEELNDHEVKPHCVVADSGDDTTHVYTFCMEHGYSCLKGDSIGKLFAHPRGARRIFSPFKPLHKMISRKPRYNYIAADGKFVPHPHEPKFIFYSKFGIFDKLEWLRASRVWEVPGDVSQDYRSHGESWERVITQHSTTREIMQGWRQIRKRDDLRMCEAYLALIADMSGVIGAKTPQESEQQPTTETEGEMQNA